MKSTLDSRVDFISMVVHWNWAWQHRPESHLFKRLNRNITHSRPAPSIEYVQGKLGQLIESYLKRKSRKGAVDKAHWWRALAHPAKGSQLIELELDLCQALS